MAPSTLGWRPAAGRDSGRCSGLLFVAIKQEHTALYSGMNTMLVCKSPSLLVNIRIVLQHHLVDTVNACSDFKLPSREGKTAWFHPFIFDLQVLQDNFLLEWNIQSNKSFHNEIQHLLGSVL